ncbi:MAG: hypothetical protein ACJ763_10325 [Bdellovibrionia bacterium]
MKNAQSFSTLFTGLLLASCFAATITPALAGKGGETGGGGDICEDRFKTVRDDIRFWIEKGGSDHLKLAFDPAIPPYRSAMSDKIVRAQISCTSDKVMVGTSEKTCKNYIDQSGTPRILCNSARFMATSESDQYVLVHHEYAGLAGLETPDGESSNYAISNQLTGFLEDQVVKKLAIKPVCAGCQDKFATFRERFNNANPVKSVRSIADHISHSSGTKRLILIGLSHPQDFESYDILYIEPTSESVYFAHWYLGQENPDKLSCRNVSILYKDIQKRKSWAMFDGDELRYSRKDDPFQYRITIRESWDPAHHKSYFIAKKEKIVNEMFPQDPSSWVEDDYFFIDYHDHPTLLTDSNLEACEL